MIELDFKHDPKKNANLIANFSFRKFNLQKAVQETDRLFHENAEQNPVTFTPAKKAGGITRLFKNFHHNFSRAFLTVNAGANIQEFSTVADADGNLVPEWKSMLDEEYARLEREIEEEVCVGDFGAVGDGVTDDTEAFKKAIDRGKRRVIIPPGVYITKGIRLPSWTILSGSGKGATTIKLNPSASKGTRLVTNMHHWWGNHHISVEGLSLDWNVERLGNTKKTSTWGNHSSCLTYANVTFGWVKETEAINPGLHCFDISSTLYDYSGDGYRARGGSQFIWLDKLNGKGFGDDGITTHHSDNIFISNCHMCDPSGRAHAKGFSNSNGIEVDDGSRNVWLLNNSTARCFGGVEIKAHETSSAGNNVVIIGHLSLNDNRSYNFRHIGHHKNTDPDSATACNIRATNLIAIAPKFTELYAESDPRALVVSAYKNVVINHFSLIGDPDYDYKGNPVIAIQYKAKNVVLSNVSIRDFKHAGSDIKIFGGEHHADHISVRNVTVKNSAPQAIRIGKGLKMVSIQNLEATGFNGKYAVKADDPPFELSGVQAEGYSCLAAIAGKKYTSIVYR
ncbi:glycosyl hydrolase family 28-related protein [Mesobacillus zeae]|uniref:Pectate lyase n=1 Tax=Mesobacillus zeae TaxID=1917180 RepID=A0A398AX99_9BACI|nr:glycosyl hydrolase family 28-related protein [Mesobacillus zeae]RID82277.1 pectate lyase [Mesobacillus zeae]